MSWFASGYLSASLESHPAMYPSAMSCRSISDPLYFENFLMVPLTYISDMYQSLMKFGSFLSFSFLIAGGVVDFLSCMKPSNRRCMSVREYVTAHPEVFSTAAVTR